MSSRLFSLLLLTASTVVTNNVNAECTAFYYEVAPGKATIDYTTYYTTLTQGDIKIHIQNMTFGDWDYYYNHYDNRVRLRIVGEDGNTEKFSMTDYASAGDELMLAESVDANLKFRLQLVVDPPLKTLEHFNGTICYPTETPLPLWSNYPSMQKTRETKVSIGKHSWVLSTPAIITIVISVLALVQ